MATQTIPVESFSGKQLCRVPPNMTDENIILDIQSKLGIDSMIQLFRHPDVVMYGIMDDRPILLGMPFADQLKWDLEKPYQEWERCTFEGTILTKLDLFSLDLTKLPSELGHLTNLQELSCRYNQLTELPSELGQLTNLQHLSCQGNQLTELPSELGQLSNLQQLRCSDNRLTELPSELGQLTNLQKLLCHDNDLTELPSELGQLTNLQTLWCHRNRLTELPSELGHLTNFQELSCQHNRLTEIPHEILALKDHGCLIYQ